MQKTVLISLFCFYFETLLINCLLENFMPWINLCSEYYNVPKMTLQSGVTDNKTYLFTLLSITELHALTPWNTVHQLIGWVLPQRSMPLKVKVKSFAPAAAYVWAAVTLGWFGSTRQQTATSAAAAASRTTWKSRDATQLASDSPGRLQSREVISSWCGVGCPRGMTQLRGCAASEHGAQQGLGH